MSFDARKCYRAQSRRSAKKEVMDQKTKTAVLHEVIRKYAAGGGDITSDDWRQFVEAQNDGYRTGPEIGEKVPDFTLPDQHGKRWTLAELMGSNGLLLVFSRSADW
jgi:hypothetical protein